MADEKTVYVTFEFQSNAGEEVQKITGKLSSMDTEASKAFRNMTNGSTLSARGIGAQGAALDSLPSPLKSATSGFGSLIKAAKAFIATPIGAILGAIVLALKALTTWFSSSADGQMEFAKVSGYVSGVLGQLKEILFTLGKTIYNVFTDGGVTVKKFWETIKTNIVNRMEGVGEMFKAVGKIISSGFTDGFADLKEATLKAATGVEHLDQKIGDYVSHLHKAGKATSDLKAAEEQLSRDRSNFQKKEAELDVRMQELRTKMDSASTAERLKLAEEYRSAVSEKYAQEKAFLEEELRIKKELNGLTTNSQAEYDEVNRLEAALIRLKAEEQQALHSVDRQKKSNLRTKDSGADGAAKLAEETLKKQKEYQADWEKNQLAFAERQIELLDDSFYKQQQQNELNYQKSLADIKKQETDLLSAKKEAYGESATLTADEEKYFENLRSLAKDEYGKQSKELAKSINEAFAENRLRFADELTVQLADIDSYYAERIKQAQGNKTLIAELFKSKEKEIALAKNGYTQQMLQYDLDVTKKRLENAKSYSKTEADRREAELKAEKRHAEERIRLMEEQYRNAPTDELAKKIALAKEELIAFNRELERIPKQRIAETADAFGKIIGALGNLDGEIGEVFSSLSGSFDSISKSFSSDTSTMAGKMNAISAAISGTVEIINMCISATNQRRAAEKEFYKNSIAFAHEYALSLNEQARMQSTSGRLVTDYAGQINDSFASLTDAMSKYNEAMSKLSEGKAKKSLRNAVDWGNVGKGVAAGAMAAVGSAALVGAAIGTAVGPIGTAIGAAVGAVVGGLVGLFKGKKKKNEYGGLLEVFPELVDAAGNLNKELAQSLINTDQVNDETKQLLKNALDWAEAIEKAKEQISKITTELAGSLGDNLRNALVNAWKAGEDSAAAMFDAASGSLENFVTQLLYSTLFSDIFDKFSDRLTESLLPIGDQNIIDDYDWLMEQMQAKDDLYLQLLDSIKKRAQEHGYKKFGESDAPKGTRTASAKGITAVTQNSIDEMNGRLTAELIYLDGISLSVGGINKQLVAGVTLLREIADNTSHCEKLGVISEDIRAMKTDISAMNSRGINIKTA